ncbi:MAG TPA: hypothetical protein VFL90_17450 [Methylomirabilota bacterium]|nr:hypothetical protein [Methylomirabilota bacterium]
MKKPAAKKTKAAARSKPRAKAAARTTKAAKTRASGGASYTPAPLKGDGWPPFRYPLL